MNPSNIQDPEVYYKIRLPSSSSLVYLVTGTQMQFWRCFRGELESTYAQIDGQLRHIFLLEPENILECVEIINYSSYNSGAARAEKERISALGKYPMLEHKFNEMMAWREYIIQNNPLLIDIIKRCKAEQSIVWECEGEDIKSRLDLHKFEDGFLSIYDVKNFSAGGKPINEKEVDRMMAEEVLKKMMHFQGGGYREALIQYYTKDGARPKFKDYAIIFIEKSTWQVIIRTIPKQMLDIGYELFKLSVRLYKQSNPEKPRDIPNGSIESLIPIDLHDNDYSIYEEMIHELSLSIV